mmetsp:Transcript_71556/g.141921  ORF Transcript_71556/g.141921 Transcript_71556/m.141921 type:complete len:279 (-) Transcript_71556:222-1058(-)|eukprot:CAMPEP_0172676660 /NCGR_PEP_ID=MMETSP1074-20121228/14142_1 /TAXON_ID=2916 /ORGANISM="Ceratium fusus, Strain PA161109" /LENGTH=278 /DNA_ID=CAMNT_0013494375 /DNA_START=40 /DNA_END=876 /DNA_ORIENTATION=-
MAKKPRRSQRDRGEEKTISFDPKSRIEYITGFRKRKEQRRRKAILEGLERERQENIQVRKELRDEVKQKWKELAWAEKRADRLVDHSRKMLKNNPQRVAAMQLQDADGLSSPGFSDHEEEEDDDEALQALTTVAFDREEDDPFGGCEVTTTLIGVGADHADGLFQPKQLATLADGEGSDGKAHERSLALQKSCSTAIVSEEEAAAHRKRRAEALAREAKKHLRATNKRVTKILVEHRDRRKGGTKAKGQKKFCKASKSAKMRRKRAQSMQKKACRKKK